MNIDVLGGHVAITGIYDNDGHLDIRAIEDVFITLIQRLGSEEANRLFVRAQMRAAGVKKASEGA